MTNEDSETEQIVAAKLVQAKPAAELPQPQTGLYERVKHSRIAILAVLFLMTGFLGLPLLWMNPSFSTSERWFWAIVNTIYTCLLIALAAWVVMWSWSNITGNLF